MPFVIAEAGVNHNGDVNRALEMVDRAAAAGANAVKFQTFSADEIIEPGSPTAAYQQRNTGNVDQFAMLKTLELPPEAWKPIVNRCAASGIEFMSTPFDPCALMMLLDLGMKRIKVPSGEIVNTNLLTLVGNATLPVILSTGMSTLPEVTHAVSVLQRAGATDLTVLHCTSDYPAPIADVNLRAMVAMGDFLDLPYGYSDHTIGDQVAIAATALGARVIEKHFTLSRDLPGPDHKVSLEPDELTALISRITDVEIALGDVHKEPSPAERETAKLVRRSWHALRPIAAGVAIAKNDMTLRRPATGLAPQDTPIGRVTNQAIPAGSPILNGMLR